MTINGYQIEPRRAKQALLALLIGMLSQAHAFQILPKVSDVDRKLTGLGGNFIVDSIGQFFVGNALPMIKSPVHEAITLAALGCGAATGNEQQCVTVEAITANRTLLYGVRWPDDPPFALSRDNPPRIPNCDVKVTLRSTAQPKCWNSLFNDASTKAKRAFEKNPTAAAFGPGDYLLYRSHFGDLQFMHAMAVHDGERAGDTAKQMKMWARFLWGIAINEIPTDKFIRELGMDDLTAYFPGDLTAINLFATGIVEVRKDLDKVAAGALLHMVQDSFSQAHADRATETGAQCNGSNFAKPGRITRFYSYGRQVGSLHDDEDTFSALGLQTIQNSPHVVDITKAFLTLWQEKASWMEAEKLFDCVFDVQNIEAPAGPGRFVKAP